MCDPSTWEARGSGGQREQPETPSSPSYTGPSVWRGASLRRGLSSLGLVLPVLWFSVPASPPQATFPRASMTPDLCSLPNIQKLIMHSFIWSASSVRGPGWSRSFSHLQFPAKGRLSAAFPTHPIAQARRTWLLPHSVQLIY